MRHRILLAVLAVVVSTAAPRGASADDGFRVIVHPSSAGDPVTRSQLSQLFLKKVTRWPNGAIVHPVEPADERLRERFSERVHGKSLNALRSYWNQVIFSGRDVPPLEKPSDDDVVSFVRTTPGAFGYVSPGTAAAGVKTLAVKD